MSNQFLVGQRVVCTRTVDISWYNYDPALGHTAIITEVSERWLDVVWETPRPVHPDGRPFCDGGYDRKVFEPEGGPW